MSHHLPQRDFRRQRRHVTIESKTKTSRPKRAEACLVSYQKFALLVATHDKTQTMISAPPRKALIVHGTLLPRDVSHP